MKIESISIKMELPAAVRPASMSSSTVAAALEAVKNSPGALDGHAAPAPQQAVALLNQALQDDRRDLRFRIDESSGRMVVEVIAAGSGDVIRQVPGDEVLRMASMLLEGASMDSLGLEAWS